MENNYIQLFACCLLVKGVRRSTVVDIQRGAFIFLPLQIADILMISSSLTSREIMSGYSEEDKQEIVKYFEYLVENEYAFYTNDPQSFPPLSLDWKTANHITNAIIDYDCNSSFNVKDVIFQLERLGCAAIQFRFYNCVDYKFLFEILDNITEGIGRIRNIELTICFNDDITKKQYLNLIKQFPRIIRIIVHSAPSEYNYKFPDRIHELQYFTQRINDETHCGFVSPEYFRINKYFFTESQQFNSCLNRKISVDRHGEIKNCPAMKSSYGNISSTTLQEVSHRSNFQEVWSLNKDKINICSDCEFRYMCTDCRAFTQKEQDKYSKPLKCKYDPYTMSWA